MCVCVSHCINILSFIFCNMKDLQAVVKTNCKIVLTSKFCFHVFLILILQFNTQLHALISNGKTTFVVFINGAIHPLQNIIEQRKKLMPEPVIQTKIKNIIHRSFENTFYIGFTVEDDNNFYLATCNTSGIKYTKIDISRDELSLRGLCFHKSKNKMVLLVICKY